MTHWRFASEMCSAFCADGNAMFTMLASSTTISCAMAMTPRASQRRGSDPATMPVPRSPGTTSVVLITCPLPIESVPSPRGCSRYVMNSDRPSQDDPRIVHLELTDPTSARILRRMGARQPAVVEMASSEQWEALWPADLTLLLHAAADRMVV